MTKLYQPNGYKHMEFSRIIQAGQNPKGFTAQTVVGTAKAGNCPGWNKDYQYTRPEVAAEGVWANANRSGE